MSRSSRSCRRAADDGFTLIEVLVALVLFALFSAAAVPLIVTSLRASTVSKFDTGARQLTQERFEVLRNLPYHVPPRSDGAPTSPDLLDLYYPNATDASTGVEDSGYVTTGTRRDGEPASGSFYRTVLPSLAGFDKYRQYIGVQFLTTNGTAATPPGGWTTTAVDVEPVTLTVGVSVTTQWTVGNLTKQYNVFTEIGAGRQDAPVLTSRVQASALRIVSVQDGADVLLEGGVLNSDGNLTSGPKASVFAQGAFASLNPGSRASGHSKTATAPPDGVPADVGDDTTGTGSLVNSASQTLATFGPTKVQRIVASTAGGVPSTGSSGVPVVSKVSANGGGVSFSNIPTLTDAALGLSATTPIVVSTATSGAVATTSGWTAATTTTPTSASTQTSMTVTELQVLRTSFAPQGLIKVRLDSSTFQCSSGSAGASGAIAYSGELSYLKYDPVAKTSSYVPVPLSSTSTSDPLDAVPLTTPVGEVVVSQTETETVTRTLLLDEYITSMDSHTAGTLAGSFTTVAKKLEGKMPGVISVATKPLRAGDLLSGVTLQLGVHSCQVEDLR